MRKIERSNSFASLCTPIFDSANGDTLSVRRRTLSVRPQLRVSRIIYPGRANGFSLQIFLCRSNIRKRRRVSPLVSTHPSGLTRIVLSRQRASHLALYPLRHLASNRFRKPAALSPLGLVPSQSLPRDCSFPVFIRSDFQKSKRLGCSFHNACYLVAPQEWSPFVLKQRLVFVPTISITELKIVASAPKLRPSSRRRDPERQRPRAFQKRYLVRSSSRQS
jgi:hypothetical protein